VSDEGAEEVREATPDMITHIQWRINKGLGVGREVVVSYRVQVR